MKTIFAIFFLFITTNIFSQTSPIVFTAIPNIELNANTALGGLADIGVVSAEFYPDAGIAYNPALLSNKGEYAGIALSSMPMYLSLIEGASNECIYAFYALDSKNVIAYNYTQFNLGAIEFYDEYGYSTGEELPMDAHHKFSYARALSNSLSLGAALKVIKSMPNNNLKINTFAFDMGISYRKKHTLTEQIAVNTNFGSALNNIGPKISYDEGATNSFIPTNLKLGAMLSPEYKVSSKIQLNWEFAVQFDKFLVPSIPQYGIEDSREIVKGYDPNISSFRALYQSFYDSPEGLRGELNEINFKAGTELRASYDNKMYLALRFGRNQPASYIENNYLNTLGIGIGLFGFSLDFKTQRPNITSNPDKNFAISLAYRVQLQGNAFRF